MGGAGVEAFGLTTQSGPARLYSTCLDSKFDIWDRPKYILCRTGSYGHREPKSPTSLFRTKAKILTPTPLGFGT